MTDLKPCPFCGEKPKKYVCDTSGAYIGTFGSGLVVLHGRKIDHLLIMCPKCGIRTKTYLTDKGAINAWNRRTKQCNL